MNINIEDLHLIINKLEQEAINNKKKLIKLDAALGDGDLGITMVKAFSAAKNYMESYEEQDIGKALKNIGFEIANEAAATMGTIIASAFMKAGKSAACEKKLDYKDILDLTELAIEGIKERGNAELGDKTILDCLIPAYESFKQAYENNKNLQEGLNEALIAAEKGVEKTTDMVSSHGRAHYYGEESKGKKDPGAVAALIFLKSINEYIQQK